MSFEMTPEQHLAHYGTPRRSGRYPYGSGDEANQRNRDFLGEVAKLKAQGLSEPKIAEGLGLTTTQLRARKSIANAERKAADVSLARRLREERGMSNVAIGERMGINESSVRALLAEGANARADLLQTTANMLKDEVSSKGLVDIGSGVENHLGVSKEKLGTAVAILKEQGYEVHSVQVNQIGTGPNNKTLVKVLAPPGTTYRDIVSDISKIQTLDQVGKISDDGGRSFYGLLPPIPISPKRVGINYAEDGGDAADGVIYVRPGVKDVDLGGASYAQVRINVGGTHYLKGMAFYKDDLPEGVDLLFNTNKKKGTPMMGDKDNTVLKAQKDDPDNPFGAAVRQIGERNDRGELTKVTSAMNIVNEAGDWDKWSRNLSSQTLSKQSSVLAKSQLDMTYEKKRAQFEEIKNLTNPAVRQKLLKDFSEGVDSSAIHLKAAALPRSSWHVLLPFNSLKENEIYAPNYRDGERVALIRYPHGGTFEIPELTVNNKARVPKAAIGSAKDAVGINAEVAKRLSGADFDGDAVLVIPNNQRRIQSTPALEKLKDFDPQAAYPAYEGMPKMSAKSKGTQMGLVSNLITDMTIQRASTDELARAVKHSMVVIDAEKHNLNYKLSAQENGIPALMQKYQGRSQGGAATLISRATSTVKVRDYQERAASRGGSIDPKTGKKIYEPKGEPYLNAKGQLVYPKKDSVKLAETDDAFTLSSGTKIEAVYAQHSNRLKALANDARKEMVNTPNVQVNNSAKQVYKQEIQSLDAKLNVALKNRPLERQAQVVANSIIAAKIRDNPRLKEDAGERKKMEAQALAEARTRTGAGKQRIKITDDEWAAIQAGAIAHSKLTTLLANADMDRVKELAQPRTSPVMTSVKQTRAKQMLNAGYTPAEVADALGVNVSTLKSSIAADE